MPNQEKYRIQVKIAKALNEDIYFKDFADYLNINEHSFYNWLNGYYNLSEEKIEKLNEIIVDLVD